MSCTVAGVQTKSLGYFIEAFISNPLIKRAIITGCLIKLEFFPSTQTSSLYCITTQYQAVVSKATTCGDFI